MTGDANVDGRMSELFDRNYRDVVAYCARRIGFTEAEDAAADVFAVAVRRADDIDWDTVRPWLFGVARGVLANRRRAAFRRSRLAIAVAGLAANPEDRPDEVVVRRTEDEEALAALGRVGSGDREVLRLAAWEELTAAEIAIALQISVMAAEQRLHRAKHRYARALGSPVPTRRGAR